MDFFIRLSAARPQNAYGIDNHIDIGNERTPRGRRQQLLEAHGAPLTAPRFGWNSALSSLRIACTDDDVVSPAEHCSHRVATDKTGSAQH
jgi:hypothetical protein